MTERTILLTIKREYAEQILASDKPFEYRKTAPRITEPTRTIMYVSTGTREVIGEFTMGPISGDRTPVGFPLPVSNPLRYAKPLLWKSVRQETEGIRPPTQNFRYLDPKNAEDARLLEMLEPSRING